MECTLTEHARKRLAQRKVRIEWIEAALERPQRIEPDGDDPGLVHALIYIPERFRMLRVIYRDTCAPPLIITAYFEEAEDHET